MTSVEYSYRRVEPARHAAALTESAWIPRIQETTDSVVKMLTTFISVPQEARTDKELFLNYISREELPRLLAIIPKLERDVFPTMKRLLELRPDWDSYGATKIVPSAAAEAVRILLTHLDGHSRSPNIVPSANGGIQLEWHTDDRELDIEISPSLQATVYFVDEQEGAEWEAPLAQVDRERLVKTIAAF